MDEYLQPGRFIDSDHPEVIAFAERNRGASADLREQAVSLYYAVRDQVRYNPYTFSRDPHTLKASHALSAGESYCVPKALLLAACSRHCGIPARIGLADVRNHLATPRLLALLRARRDDPSIEPADIVVMAPDIGAYVPLLPAVFGPAITRLLRRARVRSTSSMSILKPSPSGMPTTKPKCCWSRSVRYL